MSPQLDTLYQRVMRRLRPDDWLVNTYTRERRVAGTKDPYGETTYTYASPEPGIACFYKDTIIQNSDVSGNPVVVDQVTLTLMANDPLDRGDRVSQIMDRHGRVIDTGPMYVRAATTRTPVGPVLYSEAVLQEAEGQG